MRIFFLKLNFLSSFVPVRNPDIQIPSCLVPTPTCPPSTSPPDQFKGLVFCHSSLLTHIMDLHPLFVTVQHPPLSPPSFQHPHRKPPSSDSSLPPPSPSPEASRSCCLRCQAWPRPHGPALPPLRPDLRPPLPHRKFGLLPIRHWKATLILSVLYVTLHIYLSTYQVILIQATITRSIHSPSATVAKELIHSLESKCT